MTYGLNLLKPMYSVHLKPFYLHFKQLVSLSY